MRNTKYILFIVLLLFLVGCNASKEIIREVPVEVPVVHDVYHNIYVHDTTHTTDSTIIYKSGDTIFRDRYKYIYISKNIHDTLIIHDTISNTVYITDTKTEYKNKPQWWPVWLSLGIILCYFLITKTKFIQIIKNIIKIFIKLFK